MNILSRTIHRPLDLLSLVDLVPISNLDVQPHPSIHPSIHPLLSSPLLSSPLPSSPLLSLRFPVLPSSFLLPSIDFSFLLFPSSFNRAAPALLSL
jgi:hypothetical protein